MAADDHRVDARFGTRPVRTPAEDRNVEKSAARHHRSRADGELAYGETGCIVHPEQCIAPEAVEHAFAHHCLGAAEALFRRLKDEVDRPVEIARLGEIAGGTQEHRGMAVMAARMHASIMARAVLEAVGFCDRQRIHIGAQTHRARRIADSKPADDAGPADAAMDLAAKLAELRAHQIGSPPFLEPELGVGMNVAPPACQIVVHLCDTVDNWHARPFSRLGAQGASARRPQARRLRSSSLCRRPRKIRIATRARGMRHRTAITTAAATATAISSSNDPSPLSGANPNHRSIQSIIGLLYRAHSILFAAS